MSSACISTAEGRAGAVRGREDADPGAGSHPADVADQAGQGAADDARLQAQRHDQPLRGVGDRDRRGHRGVLSPAQPPGVPRVPQPAREGLSATPLHVVLDNSSTHSTPEVERWLGRHKRVHFHFTPTSASWMNMVEIWFSILTKQQVRRGVYHDVPELIAAIEHYIDGYNERAQPFVWTKTADQILARPSNNNPLQEPLASASNGGARTRAYDRRSTRQASSDRPAGAKRGHPSADRRACLAWIPGRVVATAGRGWYSIQPLAGSGVQRIFRRRAGGGLSAARAARPWPWRADAREHQPPPASWRS